MENRICSLVALLALGCGGSDGIDRGYDSTDPVVDAAAGGQVATVTGAAGTMATGGASVVPATGGAIIATGGAVATGGVPPTTGGSTPATGGRATGGAATGGKPATGGAVSAGGAPPATGGSVATGGSLATTGGAAPATGGAPAADCASHNYAGRVCEDHNDPKDPAKCLTRHAATTPVSCVAIADRSCAAGATAHDVGCLDMCQKCLLSTQDAAHRAACDAATKALLPNLTC
jgi:hypothetical protein